MAARSLYHILQVDPRAEQEVIEGAYRRLARKYHPDVSGAADAERRMKEINSAYSVLGEPIRRTAYDRELSDRNTAEVHAGWSSAVEAGPACALHQSTPAASACRRCDRALCGDCLERFQPPTCAHCVLSWARGRRLELLAPVGWFFITIAFVSAQLGISLTAPGLTPSSQTVITILVVTYIVASIPCAWRLWSEPGEPVHLVPALLGAAFVGPLIAPFRIAKILSSDMRQIGHLAALAKEAERGGPGG